MQLKIQERTEANKQARKCIGVDTNRFKIKALSEDDLHAMMINI